MAKGLFTQGMCVLLRTPMPVESIQERLQRFSFVGVQVSPEIEDQFDQSENLDAYDPTTGDCIGTLAYEFRPEVGGHLLITPSSAPWPDEMGDPDESPERFVAWSLGQFGPLAYPGCLKRATTQSWGWEEASEVVPGHVAHIRLLISYVMVGEDDAETDSSSLVPEDYDAVEELHFLTRAVTALLEAPEALCYFNPGGEVLRGEGELRQGLNYAWNHDLPPLDMWTNVRLFTAEDGWVIMDTVGNGQLDLPDVEAIFLRESFDPSSVESFLRHASLYLLTGEDEVCTGDTADGPGDVSWQALECDEGLSDPPRPTIRWFPEENDQPIPDHLLDPGSYDEDVDELDLDELDERLGDNASGLSAEEAEELSDELPPHLFEQGEYDFLDPRDDEDDDDDVTPPF